MNIKNIIKRILPWKLYKLIANGFIIVPRYYRDIIDDAEKSFDLSLEDSDKKEMLLLRKYAHVIDKGLHREDAEPGHSGNYYKLLCRALDRLAKTDYVNDPTYVWADSKRRAYELLQTNPEAFQTLKGTHSNIDISFSQFEALVKARRSNRQFEDRLVENSIIDKLRNLANWSSSSCNKQPIEIYTTNDPAYAAECLKCCKGGTGFGEVIPSFWVFTANVRGYVWPSEIYLPAVDTCLGLQNVMLGATTLGLSGTLLSWAQKSKEEEARLRKLMNIPQDQQIVLCAVIGYASVDFQKPDRKNI